MLAQPTNDDVIAVLEGTTTEQQSNEPSNLKINKLCVVLWQNCDAGYEWYIGYVKNVTADSYCVDHLHWVIINGKKKLNCYNKWNYLSQEDFRTAEFEQTEWDITTSTRKRFFTVKNIKYIIDAFNNRVK